MPPMVASPQGTRVRVPCWKQQGAFPLPAESGLYRVKQHLRCLLEILGKKYGLFCSCLKMAKIVE